MRRRIAAGLDTLTREADRRAIGDISRRAAIGFCFGGLNVLDLARTGADVQAVVSMHGTLATPQPARRGDIKAAIEEFGQAVENDPNYAKAFYNMGKVFARQGELEKATENYWQAMKLSPKEAEIRLGLGNVLARQGQLEAAAAQFEQATKLRPDFADAQLALAGSLAAQGKKDEAERQYQKAMQLLKSQNRSEN